MAYLESIIDSSGRGYGDTAALPLDAVAQSLALRFSPITRNAFETNEAKLSIQDYSYEQKQLLRTRVAGSMATRLALASYQAPNTTPFFDLPDTIQADTIHGLVDTYSTAYAQKASEPHPLTIDNSVDPLAPISNRNARRWVYEACSAAITPKQHLELLGSYLNFLPGSFPKIPHTITPIAENDAVFTQAFGRDSITDDELVMIKEKRQELGDDRLMMEYLDSINFIPGPSNNALADTIASLLNADTPKEQMVQWEVAHALWGRHHETYTAFEDYLHILWPSRGFYPTYEVKRDSIKAMEAIGAHNPAELAHRDMMIRALGIISRQGVITDPIAEDIPFDPGSTQLQVRNPWAWSVREFLTRGEHAVRGRVKF